MAITLVLAHGFGNQLFEYAAARTLSLIHRTTLVVDLRKYLYVEPRSSRWCWLTDLPLKAGIRSYRYSWMIESFPARVLDRIANPVRHCPGEVGFHPDLFAQPNGAMLLAMYQSPLHFEDYYEHFAHELDLSALPEAANNTKIDAFDLPGAAAVHVRRGDYLNYPDFVLTDTSRYYGQAMAEIRERGERAVIFSDDIEWCKEQEFFAGAEFYPESKGAPYIDMHAMSLCKKVVIANSTYSWWAGWFAHRRGAEVVAPKSWAMGYTSAHYKLIPSAWRVL